MGRLTVRLTKPIEREYEAWVVSGIEAYFESLGIPHSIIAVSPCIERLWPADERLLANSKVFGLQFKQAKLSSSKSHPYEQLHWNFHAPPGQYARVVANPEIYYCLPTFINREYRKQAIHHCLFWRPDPAKMDMNAWYRNPRAQTPYANLDSAARWGLFVEQLFDCKFGRRVNNSDEIMTYLHELQQSRDQAFGPDEVDFDEAALDEGLYLLRVSLDE